MLFWTTHSSVLDSTFFVLDSTFWLESTLKIDPVAMPIWHGEIFKDDYWQIY